MAGNPFQPSRKAPGIGNVHIGLLPPNTPIYKTLNYVYPLKLISSAPHVLHREVRSSQQAMKPLCRIEQVPLLFMLTYGGGLLPGDSVNLDVKLEPFTRLTIATQGSTKVFPSTLSRSVARGYQTSHTACASQHLTVLLNSHSALLLIPDPIQPFRNSYYNQYQTFTLDQQASLGVVDWVTSGRPARGEVWDMCSWTGCNEIWQINHGGGQGSRKRTTPQLMLRDALYLEGGPGATSMRSLRMEERGVFGTMLLVGPIFEALATFILNEFAYQTKVGGCEWDEQGHEKCDGGSLGDERLQRDRFEQWRRERQAREQTHGILWTATRLRGVLVVKFASREVEGAKVWLKDILTRDGTVAREFGPGGLLAVQ